LAAGRVFKRRDSGGRDKGNTENRAGQIAYSAEFLLILIISLASAWTAANPFGIAILPDADSSPENSPGLANVA
jgi:hypothetical protein